MKLFKLAAAGLIAALLSACSTADVVSRNVPLSSPQMNSAQAAPIQRDYTLHSIRFVAPQDLKVSEANSYYPIADIVWRGDPMGNRPEQISQIFQTSIRAASQGLTGSRPVTVEVELVRFHSLTERTRYTIGGVHSIRFDLTIRDAMSGAIIEPTRRVNADVAGLGGQAAIAADAAGQGQKVRITNHLTNLFYRELTSGGAPTQVDALTVASSN